MVRHWKADLDHWLTPFVAALRHDAGRDMSRLCGRAYRRRRSATFPTSYRSRPKRRWRPRTSERSAGYAGRKERLSARFAALRIRVADGPPQRIRTKAEGAEGPATRSIVGRRAEVSST
jgi:hypothetical protein